MIRIPRPVCTYTIDNTGPKEIYPYIPFNGPNSNCVTITSLNEVGGVAATELELNINSVAIDLWNNGVIGKNKILMIEFIDPGWNHEDPIFGTDIGDEYAPISAKCSVAGGALTDIYAVRVKKVY